MNLLPKTHEEFSQKEYWDVFFKKRGSKAFEWYGEYTELSEHLHKYIKKHDDILIVGCGNSTLGGDLYKLGYGKITNIDISSIAIKQMQSQIKKEESCTLKYIQMDALNMSFESESFSVVLDKGTLDALMPDDKSETIANATKYFNEIHRILRVGGRYLCISLLQEHILKTLLKYFPTNNWMFRVVRCFEAESKALASGENPMPVFIVVCTKFRSLPNMILEVGVTSGGIMQRLKVTEEVIHLIMGTQKAAFVCSGLKRSSIVNTGEVSFELCKPGENQPRFTVNVIDIPRNSKNSEYAVFVVPHGREGEWLFSTSAGRTQLAKISNHNRLAVVIMHSGQQYGDFESIKKELADMAVNLAPHNCNSKILFLSLGSDIGKRLIRYKGHSEYSGDYIVEDTEDDKGDSFRRLYFLGTQSVIQSEAKLRIMNKKGVKREAIDYSCLTCSHHIYMSIAVAIACTNKEKPSVAVIGLGGGGLCMFLRKFLSKVSITGVDIDADMLKTATEWFGLKQDDKLAVEITEGIKFIEEACNAGKKFDAILFDVDSKDTTIGMSCPPKQFITATVLQNVAKLLHRNGLFVLNVVLRDAALRPTILQSLQSCFKTTIAYKLEEDLNEVVMCVTEKMQEESFLKAYKCAFDSLNNFFMRNKIDKLEDCINKLQINK